MESLKLLLFLLLLSCVDVSLSYNYTTDDLFHWERNVGWNIGYQLKTNGLAPSIFKGRGMVMELRPRTSGSRSFTSGDKSGIFVYIRQVVDGKLGKWRPSAFLVPDDRPGPDVEPGPISTKSYFCGMYMSTGFADLGIYEGRKDGTRLEYHKHAVGGNPETQSVIIASSYGFTYTNTPYRETGAAYVFTGEYYHWTQSTKLLPPSDFVTADDDDLHYGRCVSIDKQTQDTAAISCAGCDPGKYKTARIKDVLSPVAAPTMAPGTQSRGAVFIYKGSEKSGFKTWTATQMLWVRNDLFYYFGSAYLQIDGNTLVTDACRGARCTFNTFLNREYDSPMTHLFVFVKQQATGLWSEQQVLTDPVMEAEYNSKSFCYMTLHDDTIAYGNGLSVTNRDHRLASTQKYGGQVLIFYPNKPNYEIMETFRYKADVGSRGGGREAAEGSSSFRLNQHQWSLQQYLTSPEKVKISTNNNAGRGYFGKFVSLSGDRMVIGMRGISDPAPFHNPVTTLYERKRQGGQWSQQQILVATLDLMGESYGTTLYNTYANVMGARPKPYYKFLAEQANGAWDCLMVTMFDEFGDGWDEAKLRVDAPDGSYDYFYPTCDVPTTVEYDDYRNPFQFEYCPSMSHQGGLYTFYIVNSDEAKFNWEIEWRVDMDLVNWRSGILNVWGNSSSQFTGDIHTKLSFYWNPVTLSFEEGPVENVLSSTVSCTSCAVRGSHRSLEEDVDSAPVDADTDTGDEVSLGTARGLRHAAKTATPSVSPAPTMVQGSSALAEWEKLVMTTSNPLRPWFKANRAGTYFFLSDLEGKTLFRRETQCSGSSTPLTHSCWLNYPEPLADGDYVARIGGARAGMSKGLHTWKFCGITGGQSEHLEFRVQHGSCYPIQRFTTSRYCTFREHSTVAAVLTVNFGLTENGFTPQNEGKVFTLLSQILPHTSPSDYFVSNQRMDASGELHADIHVKLRVSEHGLNPGDFDAVNALEASFRALVAQVTSSGELTSALGGGSKEGVSVDMVAFDTASIPSQSVGMVDDDAPVIQTSEVIDRDWMKDNAPASRLDKGVITALMGLTDVMSVLGYLGLLACVAYGVKEGRRQYLQNRASLRRDLQSASTSVKHATEAAVSSSDGMARAVHKSLDSFSDSVYAVMTGANQRAETAAQLPEVVIPDLSTMFVDDFDDHRSSYPAMKAKQANGKSKNGGVGRKAPPPAQARREVKVDADCAPDLATGLLQAVSSSSSESASASSSSSEGESSSGTSSSDDEDAMNDLKAQLQESKTPYPSFKAPKSYTLY